MPSVLGELSPGFDFPPACVLLCCGGVYGNIVSQALLPALMWSSSHLTDVNMSLCPFLVVFFFFRENFSIYSYRFHVSVGGSEVKIFLVIILSWNQEYRLKYN